MEVKTRNIPGTVVIQGQLFAGQYVKRPGSRNDLNLYCWFIDNEELGHYPHASIDMSDIHESSTHFHVSFPVTKLKGGWSEGTERVSYSIHVQIDRETDEITVTTKTSANHWKLPEKKVNPWGFADMDRKGLEFAKLFYSAAFFQSLG